MLLGIEIGGTKLQIVTGNGDDQLLSTHRFAVKKEEGAAGIRKIIEETVKEYYNNKITAVGIGFGGPVNRITGQIATSFHIEGWSGFSMVDWLQDIVQAPVFIDNDANVAALGEATYGAGKDYNNVLYITVGSGVGGGLVINQQIYHGAIPGEIEIGHIQMDRSGATLQSCCSGWAVDEKIRNAIVADPGGLLAKLIGNNVFSEASFLNQALEANDKIAKQIFEETTDDLAFGLSHAIHLLHPEIIIIGGGLSLLGEIFRLSVELKLPRYLMKAFAPGPVVRLAQLKEMAVPIGSLILAAQNISNND
jgi:glucokinase